jgi:hypothetical protein
MRMSRVRILSEAQGEFGFDESDRAPPPAPPPVQEVPTGLVGGVAEVVGDDDGRIGWFLHSHRAAARRRT